MKIVLFVGGIIIGLALHHALCYMGLLERFAMVCPCKKDSKVSKKKKK